MGAASAFAASPTDLPQFNLERLELNPSAADTLAVSGGALLPQGVWRTALALDYERRPLLLYSGATLAGAVVSDRVVADLLAAWAPLDSLEVGLILPIVGYQRGDDLTAYGLSSPSTAAVSGPLADARYAFLQERRGAPVDLSAQLQVGVPLGQPGSLANDTQLSVYPKVMAGRDYGIFRVGGELGVLVRPTVSFGADSFGTQLSVGAAVSAQLLQSLRVEVDGRAQVPFSATPAGLELLAGGSFALPQGLSAFALAGPGLGQLPGTPAFRIVGGVAYSPPPPAGSSAHPRGTP